MWRSEKSCAIRTMVVDRRVPVRVVLADHVTDDTGALLVGTVPVIVQFVHREQHTAVHWLEAVAGIGQCPPDDHAHRVIKIGTPHFLFEADGQGFLGKLGHAAALNEGENRWRARDSPSSLRTLAGIGEGCAILGAGSCRGRATSRPLDVKDVAGALSTPAYMAQFFNWLPVVERSDLW
jgi:hypothetical protein